MDLSNEATVSVLWSIILGMIQGLTEFLPVSSSGHLALAQHLGLGHSLPVAFDILLHVATLLVVLLVFWKDILLVIRTQRGVLAYIVVATIPLGIAGLTLRDRIESMRDYPMLVCGGLLLTSAWLYLMERLPKSDTPLATVGVRNSIWIGLAQALALLPGVSRSGSTIAAGSLLGVKREDAIRFSFLLMIPAVAGVACVQSIEIIREPALLQSVPLPSCVAGFLAAAITGYAALKGLIHVARNEKMHYFAAYCSILAVSGLLYFGLIR